MCGGVGVVGGGDRRVAEVGGVGVVISPVTIYKACIPL